MNFLLFNLLLLVSTVPAVMIFSIGVVAIVAPLSLFVKTPEPPKVLIYPLLGLAGAFQVYFWGLWAAFCVLVTMRYTADSEVTWDWLYWIAAFGWCTSLIGWFAHKEQQTAASAGEAQDIARGTRLYSLIAIVAFVVFALAPPLVRIPYGWAFRLIGY